MKSNEVKVVDAKFTKSCVDCGGSNIMLTPAVRYWCEEKGCYEAHGNDETVEIESCCDCGSGDIYTGLINS